MRPLYATELISVDGVVEAPGNGDYEYAGWTFKDVEHLDSAYAVKGREQEEATALLLGRKSFQEFVPFWPSMPEFARYNEMPKYVLSTTLSEDEVKNCGWNNCHLVRSLDEVRELLAGEGGPVLTHGSPTLVRSLMKAQMLRRLTLLEFPVILGHGMRLFADDGVKIKAILIDNETYSNGIRLAIYDLEY